MKNKKNNDEKARSYSVFNGKETEAEFKRKLEELPETAHKTSSSTQSFFKKNRKKIESSDQLVHALHDEVFEEIDCLSCANCCRTLGPAIYDKDVERMAKELRMKPSQVLEKYLKKDGDDGYIFQSMPCPFLMPDNYCSIYESRPKACREYPHTDRKKFYQIFTITLKNTYTCPAAYEVVERLKEKL